MIDVKVCRNIELPSYLREFIDDYSRITLILNKRNEDKGNEIIDMPMEFNTSENTTHLDLTGSPLKVELNGDDDDDLDWTMVCQRFPSWTPEESKHIPITVQDARKFFRYYNLKAADEECDKDVIFCVCDASDTGKTAILGFTKLSSVTTYCVRILGCFPQAHEINSYEYMRKSHLRKFTQSVPVDFRIRNEYYAFGNNLKSCPDLDRAETNGSVAIKVISKGWVPDILEKYSNVEINLQVILGHRHSSVYELWKQLQFINKMVTILKETPTSELESVKISDQPSHLYDISNEIYNCFNLKSYERVERKTLDVENLRDETFLDNLWNVFRKCTDVSELRNAFHIMFEELAEVQTKIQIPPGNDNFFVNILNGILNGTLAVPTVTFPQSVEFLLELGLEYVKNDYLEIISHFSNIFYEMFMKEWQAVKEDQTTSSQALKRKTRTMLSKMSVIDMTNINRKLQLVTQMHILVEFLFLSKEQCNISEDNSENLHVALFDNNFISCHVPHRELDDMIQRLHEVSFTLDKIDMALIKG